MKKRTISTILASAMILAGNLTPVYAAENNDLGALASSLGADTSYLNVPFVWETTPAPDGTERYSYKGYYISTIEVLVHNGVLKADDLQSGTSDLTDVSDSTALREKLRSECGKLDFHRTYQYTFRKDSAKDKIPALLATAEKASAKNEYFLIGYSYLKVPDGIVLAESGEDVFHHHATGIGVTDGSWTFNGKTYDKCILTLDSANTMLGGKAFSEDTCIYINSETYDYYIPEYSDNVEDDIQIVAFDNDTLLTPDSDDLFNITVTNKNTRAFYTITSEKDGVKTVRNNDNDFLDFCHNSYNGNFYIKADSLNVACESRTITQTCIYNGDATVTADLSAGQSSLAFDGRSYTIDGAYSDDYIFPIGSAKNNCFDYEVGDTSLQFYGRIMNGFSFEPSDGSFFIDSTDGVRFVNNQKQMGNIFTLEKTEVKFDENGITGFFIDKDNDGQFEHKVEKGDVNCDGKIDASDASSVLQAYSSTSTGDTAFLNYSLSDWDGNEKIDASDASFILQKYAELSTT